MTKLYGMKAQLQGVSLQLMTLKSTAAMSDAMRGATKAMRTMGAQMSPAAITGIMRDFERQSAAMEMGQEMMGDAMDDAMEARARGGFGRGLGPWFWEIFCFWGGGRSLFPLHAGR